jgi:heme-degrading monooxygenase HmoA
MLEVAESMPGFVSYKVFAADDGERCTIVEFGSFEDLRAWREHPEHREAMRAGRDRFYSEYTLQVCEPARESRFEQTRHDE